VPDHDFYFALDLSDEPHFDRMLATLSDTVLRFVGYAFESSVALTTELHDALKKGASDGHDRCDVRFTVGGGHIEIAIAYAGGMSWKVTRALPVGS
jgi:hypothetical protein